ncbi:MAG: CoA-binding protein [Patescibacteria group bacterium]|nr:CoA-binding protein [Patescibacteria group bacterium]
MQTIAIIGASNNREKFGNKAVRAYRDAGWTVFPVNPGEQMIEGLESYSRYTDIPEKIDRVSFYVPASVGIRIIEEIAQKPPAELFFNPGTESATLVARARELNLDPIMECSIVAIGKSPAEYS